MKTSAVPATHRLERAPDASVRLPYAESSLFPLSESQLPFWFFQQCNPGSAVYNLPFPVRFRGNLDAEKLAASIEDIRRRHEALQALFVATGEQPLQRLHVDQRISMPIIDLTQLPPADREAEARRLADADATEPFDLSCGPLLRTTLIKLSDHDHLLLRTVHHAVADGWSIALFRRELATFYNARIRGNPPVLSPVASFRSLVAAQQQRHRGETLQRQLTWWKQQLAGELPRLSLPFDHLGPSRTFAGKRVAISLDAKLTAGLRRLARAQQTTLFVALLAAFKVLLSRFCGQEELLVASPIASRLRPETRNVIGPFINTLLFRTDLSGDPPFVELLNRVRDVALGAFAHQDVPLEKILAEQHSWQDNLDRPLIQAMLVLEPPQEGFELDGLTRIAVPIDTGTSRFDLTLRLIEHANGLNGFFEYSTERFRRSTIEQMTAGFIVLLQSIANDPHQSISKLRLMRSEEQQRILGSQSSRRQGTPLDRCVHELIPDQALRTPDSIAIECGPQILTYGELNHRVNQLAWYLQQRGVGRETLVGVCLERSIEMVIGLLGVLKAGGAYLPLDPHHPPRRLEFMMNDSGAAMLLTQTGLVCPRVASRVPTIYIDQLQAEDRADPTPADRATADDLAYVIYTSGSTGHPKGVEISHRALANLLCSMRREPGMTAEDVLLAVTTVSFDIAALELFLPLVVGGRLVLVDENVARDGVQLALAARKFGATVMQATPSRWRLILETNAFPPGLKILCGGEPMTRELANQLLALGSSVWNLYGPTETTIWSTCCRVKRTGIVSIGQTIDNTAAYVLDKNLQPVPVGVVGELYLAGLGVARGYRGRAELTDERFLPNPFAGGIMSRMYRTGDQARLRADGSLECLGRIDQQLKIRGVRVDAGEIEAALCSYPGVRQAFVIARTDSAGEHQLIGYVAVPEVTAVDESAVHDHLRELLPRDLIPARIVAMAEMPLTTNGKVDRQSLPTPNLAVGTAASTARRPESRIECQLAKFWSELLRIQVTNIDDHFFERGGHSLLAARLASRIRLTWNVELPLRTLFEAPTLKQQASWVEKLVRERQQPEPLPALCPPTKSQTLTPASPSQRQVWLYEQMDPGGPLYHIPWTARLRGPLDVTLLERALNRVISRQDSLRTSFRAIDGELFQAVAPNLTLKLQIDDLSHLPAEERSEEAQRRARAEHKQPFCLDEGPLIRARFLRLSSEDGLLLITLHHLIADDWSLGVLQRELTLAWSQLNAGDTSGTLELPLHFSDQPSFPHAQITEEQRDSLLKYWKQKLSNAPLRLDLPADGPRTPLKTRLGNSCKLCLSHDLTAALQKLSRDRSASLFMTLLAGWQVLLSRLSGQTDFIVGAPVACRQIETEGLIGFFVNTVPLRGDLSGRPTFLEVLDRVRETVLDAIAHQDLPFEKLVESLPPEERPQHGAPLFQVLMNMLNSDEHELRLPGVAVELLPPAELYAKFDLTLYAKCHGDALHLLLVYDSQQFHHRRIEEMLSQLEQLLNAVCENPEVRVERLSLVTNNARMVLPDAAAPLESLRCPAIHEWFRRQATRVPQRIAVEDSRLRWTYCELDHLSDQLARRLLSEGIKRGELVAVLADRSAPLVWALLGILKAGAAFSILDPQLPEAKQQACLSAAGAVGLIRITELGKSDEQGPIEFDSPTLRVRVRLPRDPDSIRHWLTQAAARDDSLPNVDVNQAASVLFTSGTTGTPTAILSTHRPLSHFLQWQIRQFELNERDRFGFLSGLSHDPALRDIFTPLAAGGTIVIPDANEFVAGRLSDWLQRAGVSVIHITPALSSLVSKGEGLLPGLRYIFFGGESLTRNTLEAMQRTAPRATLVNFYGTTETPQAASWYCVPELRSVPDARTACDRIPIGHGIPSTQLLVRNETGTLCGIGELGEIYVRTPHLARGYVNETPRLAGRFLSNSSTGDPNDRVFKTGDLGRYLLDGAVECLGRSDEQINLRGVRIEPGEVVAALRRHASVRDAVVVSDDASELLIAWILTAESHVVDHHELRLFLLGQLPISMIPARFHFVDRFPLTHNRKIDHRKLLATRDESEAKAHSTTECHEEVELTDTERTIAHIWQYELQVDRIGRHDTFIDLGGYSLLAMQVIARIERELQVQITPQELLFQPLMQLAADCDERIQQSRLRTRSTLAHRARRLLSLLSRSWRAATK